MLPPLEWAFLVFHLLEDDKEEVEVQRALRREEWSIAWLSAHHPEQARTYIMGDEGKTDESEEPDSAQFLVTDRWFSDRRPLDAVLAGKGGED